MTRRSLILFLLPICAKGAKRRKKKTRPPKINTSSPFLAIPGVSQKIQNEQADFDGLERLTDDKQYDELKKDGRLIPLPITNSLGTKDLEHKWHFCRPWTSEFLKDLAAMHLREFRNEKLSITSAVRTEERQKQISKRNPNAREIDEEYPSVHLTGAVVDITKRGMTKRQILWMRKTLLPLHGKTIYIVEEFRQPCFHIMVFKNYEKPSNW